MKSCPHFIWFLLSIVEKKFLLGYGLSFGLNRWSFIPDNTGLPTPREGVAKRNLALGLQGSIAYELWRSMYGGILYRPAFLRFGVSPNQKYEHFISFYLGFRF